MTCTKTGLAVAGPYANVGTVTGAPPVGPNVVASNPDHYFGAAPSIALVKKTNGTDNDLAPGPTVTVGSTVTWTYLRSEERRVGQTAGAGTDELAGTVT